MVYATDLKFVPKWDVGSSPILSKIYTFIESMLLLLKNFFVIKTCNFLEIKSPRFCCNETLSITGNCRMCLVEVEGLNKKVMSCLNLVKQALVNLLV